MGWWRVAAGAAIVLFAVREMFNDLFHPTQSGALSEWIASRIFRICRRWPSVLATSGPLSIAVVILTWAMLLATGFALIYWNYFPAAYFVQGRIPPGSGWWWSIYYSLEMMTTLGLGDIRPIPTWLKIFSALHTFVGFSLVTASITWLIPIFPALRRMRTLARKAITMAEAEERTGISAASCGMHAALGGLAEEIIRCRVEFIHFPILFYYYSNEPRASLPCALFRLIHFAEEGKASDDRLVRLAAAGLMVALADLAELIGSRLQCRTRDPESVFRTFAELHTPRP